MPLLRVKMVLNEGGEGVPFSQLADIAEEAEKFLRYLAEDCGIDVKRGEWVARNFANRSVRFDIEREAAISVDEIRVFNGRFEYIDQITSEKLRFNGEVKHRTLLQYTKVAKALGPHEKLAFGLYADGKNRPYRYVPLTQRKAEILAESLSSEVVYRGSIQGVIHNLGVADLWFHLRHETSEDLIRCDFGASLYDDVVAACKPRGGLVYVHGLITARRLDRAILKVRAERIKAAPRLTDDMYGSFFGADPNYTGELSSDEFIERGRYEH